MVLVSESESVKVFYRLIIYLMPLEIQLSRGERWDHINRFHPATVLCMSQTSDWISAAYVVVFLVFSKFN